jgi:hypothetical protein
VVNGVPAAPTEFGVIDATDSTVSLAWRDNARNEAGFKLSRSRDGMSFTPIVTLAAGTTSYVDASLQAGEVYHYRLAAISTSNVMSPSVSAQAATTRVLAPGAGFVGSTPQPPAVGDPGAFGYGAKAIARWDVVPHQTVTDTLNVGVVAFHINGIDRVEFSLNGGTWTAIAKSSLNVETNVHEYWVTVDANTFAQAAPVDIRAIAHPTVGVPRVLEEVRLYADPGGIVSASNPVRYVSPTGDDGNDGLTPQTAKKDMALAIDSMAVPGEGRVVPAGASVYLLPGVHTWKHPAFPQNLTSQAEGSWLNIQAAPGYARGDVTVRTDVAADGHPYMLSLTRVHWRHVTFDRGLMPYMHTAGAQVWHDHVKVDGQDRFAPTTSFAHGEATGGRWVTDSVLTNLSDGAQGTTLMRNVEISNTVTGGPWMAPFVVNTTITNVDPGATGAHPDLWRTMGSMENVILYGFTTPDWDKQGGSIGLGLFTDTGDGVLFQYDGIAVVDCHISSGAGVGVTFGLGGNISHMYVKDSSFRGCAYWHPDRYSAENLVIEGTTFHEYWSGAVRAIPPFPGAIYR